MKKRIIIASNFQFGYLTDDLRMCEELSKKGYEIFFISYDQEFPLYNSYKNQTNIHIKKINKFSRIIYIIKLIKLVQKKNPDLIFIRYFTGCGFLRFFKFAKKIILDIRTGAVTENEKFNNNYNHKLKRQCSYFNRITVIDKNLADDLGISQSYVLPLGSKKMVNEYTKPLNQFNLLYVGTFEGRNIPKLINGYYKFYTRNKTRGKEINLSIVGYSIDKKYEEEIKAIVNELPDCNIKLFGKINNDDLGEIMKDIHVGISYIPIEDRFQYQPPTKTYEYIVNGLVCLATSTEANKKVINNENGLLVGDTIEEISQGIEYLYNNIDKYSYSEIANNSSNYSWENIFERFDQKLLDWMESNYE